MNQETQTSSVEKIKKESRGLRGSIVDGLNNEISGAIGEADQTIIKFHGMYQQDDRDRRVERAQKKLDRLYSFMIRLRLPGGGLRSEQWIATDRIAREYATGTIKITTRQTLQLHGIIKSKIKPTVRAFDLARLDSIATCGDVNRNVLCSTHPKKSPTYEEVESYADAISKLLIPKTRSYYEIWLDEEKISEKTEEDPLYQDHYLPRKFKIAIAIPPNNDVDVLTNDIGLIAIVEDSRLKGFNIAIGGGLSTTHGNPSTYARLGTVLGFVESGEKTLKSVYEVLTIQRDYGNRSNRKLARLKYTLDRYGAPWFKEELERRTGFVLEAVRPYVFTERRDHFGWHQDYKGLFHYTIFVENGRVLDDPELPMKTALLKVAESGKAQFRFTCHQNVILSDILLEDRLQIQGILEEYGIVTREKKLSPIRKNSMACVAFNTCPLALAEGQRYLPTLISKIELLLDKYNLSDEEIIIRMTGCPNGCARPYVAEIGLVGLAYGRYNLYLGADRQGTRLNKLYKKDLYETAILELLDVFLAAFKEERFFGESFGDFALRKRWITI
ncbi:MAG: NADPH-dependent assimilatory sulfite reductase hemoprotein subunit [Flavobacteriales bacterium Tduv]